MLSNKKTDLERNKLIVKINPRNVISEEFRVIRTNIELSGIDHQNKAIIITSPDPNSGKSVITSNLGVAYAQQGKSTLIIDCDLRKPSIQKYFPQLKSSGLTDLLTERITLEEAIVETEIDNLSILPAGFIPANPSELLGSNKMKELYKTLYTKYDQIIIDSPPVLPVADAQIISSYVDGALLVIRSGFTTKNHVLKAYNTLKQVNANVIGTILNDQKSKKGTYYYG